MSIIVIPCRAKTEKLSKHPLALLHGIPHICWTLRSSLKCSSEISIAYDDDVIAETVTKYANWIGNKGHYEMVKTKKYNTDSDQANELITMIDSSYNYKHVITIPSNIPVFPSNLPSMLIEQLKNDVNIEVSTVMTNITDMEIKNTNVVKVVVDNFDEYVGKCVFFSQQPISPSFRHINIYAYDRDYLEWNSEIKPTYLEKLYQMEQMRMITNYAHINGILVDDDFICINEKDDINKFEKLIKKDD
ncbi:MAG: hypothetical protein WC284_18800 [Candidimonas sp.]